MERETGIEPATNSLEGCDSTTELLPPTRSPTSPLRATAGRPASSSLTCHSRASNITCLTPCSLARDYGLSAVARLRCALPSIAQLRQAKAGGEGRIRTFEAAGATDLQSVAFDRFATSPIPTGGRAGANALFYFALSRMYSGFAPCATTVPSLVSLVCARVSLVLGSRPRQETWSWRRDLNPRPADYKSAALPD